MLNLKEYEHMTPKESLAKYDWGTEALPFTNVLHLAIRNYDVFVDTVDDGYGGKHACEIFKDGGLEGQCFADDPLDAIRGAVVDAVGIPIMRDEGNSEDAANVIAREAYVILFGYYPIHEMDVLQYDDVLGIAKEFVKEKARFVGIDWEE